VECERRTTLVPTRLFLDSDEFGRLEILRVHDRPGLPFVFDSLEYHQYAKRWERTGPGGPVDKRTANGGGAGYRLLKMQ
jgi:hypothetical protein